MCMIPLGIGFLRKIHLLNCKFNNIELIILILAHIINTINTVFATWSLLVHEQMTGVLKSLTGFLFEREIVCVQTFLQMTINY